MLRFYEQNNISNFDAFFLINQFDFSIVKPIFKMMKKRAVINCKYIITKRMKLKINILSLMLIALSLSGCHHRKPKVLIIGDSISIGYTPYVEKYFSDKAIIKHNPGNAQHTGTGLTKIKEWIGDEKWDIIQFNWGLWDLCYRHPDSEVQGNRDKVNGNITHNLNEYRSNLDSIVSVLEKISNAKLIFVTTTYVPKEEAGRFENDAVKYNDAAKKIMKKHGIIINDIYAKSIPVHNHYGKGADNVHYTDEGYQKLSQFIIDFLNTEIDAL